MARVVIAFGLVYVIWGSTYLAIRILVSSIPPALAAALRFTIAGPLLLAVMRLTGRHLLAPARELASLALIGFLLLVCGNGLVVWSEQHVASGLAALMVATVPLWISVLGTVLPGGERVALRGWVGIGLGMVGLGALVWPELTAGFGSQVRGEAALVLASLSWACGSLYAKRRPWTLSPLVATGWEMLFAGIVLLVIAVGAGNLSHFAPTRASWLALAYLVVFGSCVAFSAYIWLLHNVPAPKVTTYAYVNPVIAVLLGCGVAGEPFTMSMAVGTPIIIAAVILVTSANVHTEPRVARPKATDQVARTAA